MGVPSSVPSGKVHLRKESGLAWRISCGSGPAKLEEKGTLKERLSSESVGAIGEIGDAAIGLLMGCNEFRGQHFRSRVINTL